MKRKKANGSNHSPCVVFGLGIQVSDGTPHLQSHEYAMLHRLFAL